MDMRQFVPLIIIEVKTNDDAVKHANGRHRVYSVSLDHEELINLAGNSKAGSKFKKKLN
jgi:hypothetical protein